tara:strand:+ start:148 stop:1293 length:1146 start_codon:yes stop_codon:yes gene_type:complete
MLYYKFEEDDIFVNTLRTYPLYQYYIYSGSIYFDNSPKVVGQNTSNILSVDDNHISLYEYNIDRSSNYIYPFIIKGDERHCFKKITREDFSTQYALGDQITSSYRMSASIIRYHYAANATRARIRAMRNTTDHYTYRSPHYQYSSSFGNKATQQLNLVSIPSILYGSSIKKGSVSLKYYITGSLIGELSDYRMNGELVQIGPAGSNGSGSVAGVVLYNEGLLVLTGSWELNSQTIAYDASDKSKWVYFGYGANDGNTTNLTSVSSSFYLGYSGSHDTQVVTMLAKAPYENLNYSNNPTYVSASQANSIISGSNRFIEMPREVRNTSDYNFNDVTAPMDQSIYISKINIYDDDKNLIGVAKLAKPIRKTKDRQFTFKLKLDI